VWDRDAAAFNTDAAGFEPADVQIVDVADYESVARTYAVTLQRVGHLEILVNNAGINGPVLPVWEYPLDAFAKVLAVNLGGVFNCCRVATPGMRAAGYGRIINVASISGKEGVPGIAAYAASKHGVVGFTKSLARELVDSGVLVNCITPVMTETDLLKEMTPEHITASKAKIPMGRFAGVEEIAAMVAWIASPECSFTTGFAFDLSGGRANY
jgi:2-dehydro-3-deoxy-L-rhamnonate dehydrogenase (NAD+)